MACNIVSGYTLDCFVAAGVKKVHLGNYDSATTYTFDADDVITGATNGPTLFLIEQDAEYAGLEQTINNDRATGTSFLESNLSLKMTNLNKDLRSWLNNAAKAPLVAAIESNSGEFFYLGVESAGRVTEGTASLGVAFSDLNGAELTINWRSQNGMYPLDGGLIGTDFPTV